MADNILKKFTDAEYTDISVDLQTVIESNGGSTKLAKLKTDINKIFGSVSECTAIIFTRNTDKLFFGMSVLPSFSMQNFEEELVSYEKHSKPVKPRRYVLEIDSKIVNPILGFTGMHLTAILLHEMGHIILDNDTSVKEYRNAIELYCSNQRSIVSKEDMSKTISLFYFGFLDYINKTRSFFNKNEEELKADAFVHACGYGEYLMSAFRLISSNGLKLNIDVKNKFLVTSWIINIYKEMEFNRTDALRKLNKSKQLTGSVNEKRKLENAYKALNHNDNNAKSFNESTILTEAKNKFSFFDKMRYSGLRGIKNDLYELSIQVKTASDQDDALYLLRMINSRIGTLEEYINYHSENMRENEVDEWQETLGKYIDLREQLVAKENMKKVKMYGLFTDYNNLPEDYLNRPYL